MPTGIYIRTKEHRKKTSEGLIGRKVSKETREKIRKTLCSHKNIEGGCRSLEYIRKQRKEYRHRLGISKIYRIEWLRLRRDIYERDNWICQECSIKCHGNGTKDKIQCHHIDYDVKNNNVENLITLCSSCHAKTNFRRDDWLEYFNSKIGGQ